MRAYFITFLLTCFGIYGYGQDKADTILFNSGRTLAAHVLDTSGDKITIEKPKSSRHKKIEIDRDQVFSIRYGSTGKEVVVYIYDTLIGNDYTIPEARLFIAGEQDAQKGFHAIGTSIGAFLVGAGSGFVTFSLIAFGPPFIYTGIMSYPRIKIRHKSVSNLSNVKADPYLYGYDNVARRKRTLRSLLWGSIGLVVGLTANFIYTHN